MPSVFGIVGGCQKTRFRAAAQWQLNLGLCQIMAARRGELSSICSAVKLGKRTSALKGKPSLIRATQGSNP